MPPANCTERSPDFMCHLKLEIGVRTRRELRMARSRSRVTDREVGDEGPLWPRLTSPRSRQLPGCRPLGSNPSLLHGNRIKIVKNLAPRSEGSPELMSQLKLRPPEEDPPSQKTRGWGTSKCNGEKPNLVHAIKTACDRFRGAQFEDPHRREREDGAAGVNETYRICEV